ncbi:hypothetical protein NYQ10_20670 [Flavobacterium johnsoniae]|uniref:ABC-three component system middle component 1 n=1 Tax=Flavobacterium TaxID=237 RepID=UPI0015B7FD37|nr:MULTISPECIES: ABC-three component system middle component 1 [Flavobacterium]NWL02861.1 hypothetical protein [Flavobacterium collinsii]WET04012.1 hypothetical protein P0R33_06640 [Flavobacterium sp. YJ01]WJS94499.1 hypothetical protein NYQ10_20670 [Flavobacterium johnsoniae]
MKQEVLFKKFSKNALDDELRASFKDIVFFELGEIIFGGSVIVAFVQFDTEDNLKIEWKDFNNFVTAQYLSNIKDEYSKWNFYVFYLSGEKISRELKYEIENNKFSSRKIICEEINSEIDQALINKIISEYIVNDSIDFSLDNEYSDIFSKDLLIEKALGDLVSGVGKNLKEQDLSDVLAKLEKEMNNEN